jgi:hypothetical protein
LKHFFALSHCANSLDAPSTSVPLFGGKATAPAARQLTPVPLVRRQAKARADHDLATLIEVIAGGKTGWVLEADSKNFFRSLDHEWETRLRNQHTPRMAYHQAPGRHRAASRNGGPPAAGALRTLGCDPPAD